MDQPESRSPISRQDLFPGKGDSIAEAETTANGGYTNWCAIAAFFDGDGSICGSPKKDVIRIKLEFADNWRPQVEQIDTFLRSQGIKPAKIFLSVGNAYSLYLSSNASILATCKGMLSRSDCLYKKRKELIRAVDYLEDRITGTQFIESLNESVRLGNRTGKIRRVDIPYTYSEGLKQRYYRMAARTRLLTDEQKRHIVNDRTANKMTYASLAKKYGVSITTIVRALRGHR